MGTCTLCGKTGTDISTLGASHKDLGWIMVCQDCWKNLSNTNSIVAGSTCTGKCSTYAR